MDILQLLMDIAQAFSENDFKPNKIELTFKDADYLEAERELLRSDVLVVQLPTGADILIDEITVKMYGLKFIIKKQK